MSTETSLTEQELNFISSGGTTPLDDPTPAPAEKVVVEHEPDVDDATQPAPEAAAAEPVEEPAPDASADPGEPDDASDGKKNQPVPYGALHREREARKEIERQLAEVNAKFNLADQRIALIAQAIQQNTAPKPVTTEPNPQPAIPRPDEDFAGALKWTQDRLIERDRIEAEQSETQRRQQEQTHRQENEENYVIAKYQETAAELAAQDPSFTDAHKYLMQQRFNELLASGVPQKQAQQQLMRDEFAFAREALMARQNPAQRVLAVAKARGWAPAPAPVETPGPTADRLETIARGQAANKSLSTAGGSAAGRATLNATTLADMPQAEFAKLLEKDPDVVRRVMGG